LSFNPDRLTLLRERAGMTKETLAQQCGVTRRTVTDWESGHVAAPPIETLARLFEVDVAFLAREDAPDLDPDDVSFRALSSVGTRKAKRVVAAARISLELSHWFDDQYQTPGVDLPSLDDLLSPLRTDDYSPERASKMLRQIWSLSDRPVKNMLWLLERQGVRIFSLPGEDRDVDAFSFWHGGRPYIFINPDKSAERLRFDLAHELGHLILHKGVSTARERHYEMQANQFASSFLMPAAGLLAQVSTASGQLRLQDVYVMKRSWKVSAVAMVRRLFDLGAILDWHYRNWMVDLSSRGYRRGEPDGMHPEQSRLITSLLARARQDGVGLEQMSQQSGIPVRAIEEAFTGLAVVPLAANREELGAEPVTFSRRLSIV
jgi:Zn-dependent peptidase ImmA (M78 family)/DNA-binding XRE family transcriptional regulator